MAQQEQIDSLTTCQQRFQQHRHDKMFVSKGMIFHNAFWSLQSATAIRVYFIFCTKCQVENRRKPMSREHEYTIVNNGRITFSYREAQEVYGISSASFRNAIDELIEKGFIDIKRQGDGVHKQSSLYALSDRWQWYGGPHFQSAERPKRKIGPGFKKKPKRKAG